MRYYEKQLADRLARAGRALIEIAAHFDNRYTPEEVDAGIKYYREQRARERAAYKLRRASSAELGTPRKLGLIGREPDRVRPSPQALFEQARRQQLFYTRSPQMALFGDPPLELSALAQRQQPAAVDGLCVPLQPAVHRPDDDVNLLRNIRNQLAWNRIIARRTAAQMEAT